MKSKATGCGSISTVFSSTVLLRVSSIVIIYGNNNNANNNNNNNNNNKKLIFKANDMYLLFVKCFIHTHCNRLCKTTKIFVRIENVFFLIEKAVKQNVT